MQTCLLAVLAAVAAKPQYTLSGTPLGSLGGFGSVSTLPPLGVSRLGGSSLSSFPLGGQLSGLQPLSGGVKVVGIERISDSGLGFSGSSLSGVPGSSVSGFGGSVLSGGSSVLSGGSSVLSGGSGPLGVKLLSVQRIPDSALGLSGGSLSGSGLSGASLSGAGLSGASLSGAGLSGASLSGSGLSGASLSGGLSGADLASAGLSGTNLQQLAGLGGTVTKIERISSSGVSSGDVSNQLPLSTLQQILKKTETTQVSGQQLSGPTVQVGAPRVTQVTRLDGQSSTTTSPLAPVSVTTQRVSEGK